MGKKKYTYVTEGGRTIELVPVSMLEVNDIKESVQDEYRERGEQVEVPTYEITTVSGDVETHELGPNTLETEDEEETARRKALWAAHIDAKARMEREENNRVSDYMLREGVVADPDSDQEWLAHMKRLGLKVPEDPADRKFKYVTRWLIRSVDDYVSVCTEITAISGRGAVDERKLRAALSTFRNQLEGEGREAGQAPAETDAVAADGKVDARPPVRRNARRKSVGKAS